MYNLIHSIVDQTLNFQKDLTLDGISVLQRAQLLNY